MSKEVIDVKAETAEEVVDKAEQRKSRPWLSWLIIIVVLVGLALAALVYLQRNAGGLLSEQLNSRLLPLENELRQLESELEQAKTLNAGMASRVEELQSQQAGLLEDMQKAFRVENKSNNDWTLAEIEHLLVVANHRLKLESNVSLALAAMMAADERLRNNDDPGLLSIRRQLTSDINELRAVEKVDITGLVLYISDLVGRVVDLPLKEIRIEGDMQSTSSATATDAGKFEQLMSAIWQELKSLVQISRQGEESIATLPPQQRYFLYQNLRLQLESARFAVLRRDTQNFQVSLGIIQDWLHDYFDVSDAAVDSVLESLEQMSGLELQAALPSIDSSLESVRAYRRAAELPAAETQLNGNDGE